MNQANLAKNKLCFAKAKKIRLFLFIGTFFYTFFVNIFFVLSYIILWRNNCFDFDFDDEISLF